MVVAVKVGRSRHLAFDLPRARLCWLLPWKLSAIARAEVSGVGDFGASHADVKSDSRSGMPPVTSPETGAGPVLRAVRLAVAQFIAPTMVRCVRSARPSSQMFAAPMSAMSDLLVTEGVRRRARIEIERGQTQEKASVSAIEEYRQQLGA